MTKLLRNCFHNQFGRDVTLQAISLLAFNMVPLSIWQGCPNVRRVSLPVLFPEGWCRVLTQFDYDSVPLEKEYVSEHKQSSTPQGILHLAESIIECALDDVRYNRERNQALRWLFSENQEWLFSFLNICSLLQLDPLQIRRAVNAFLAGNLKKKKSKYLLQKEVVKCR